MNKRVKTEKKERYIKQYNTQQQQKTSNEMDLYTKFETKRDQIQSNLHCARETHNINVINHNDDPPGFFNPVATIKQKFNIFNN